jgi:hypothetical protein
VGKADALKEPQEIEVALGVHLAENFLRGKIVDANQEIAAQIAELLRQLSVGSACEGVEIREGRGFERAQLPQRNPVVWQNDTPCSALALTVATAAIVPAANVTTIMVNMILRRKRASA